MSFFLIDKNYSYNICYSYKKTKGKNGTKKLKNFLEYYDLYENITTRKGNFMKIKLLKKNIKNKKIFEITILTILAISYYKIILCKPFKTNECIDKIKEFRNTYLFIKDHIQISK